MIEAEAKMSKPVMEGVTVTLGVYEAALLYKFLGQTSMPVVRKILPDTNEQTCYSINQILYDLFEAIESVIKDDDKYTLAAGS